MHDVIKKTKLMDTLDPRIAQMLSICKPIHAVVQRVEPPLYLPPTFGPTLHRSTHCMESLSYPLVTRCLVEISKQAMGLRNTCSIRGELHDAALLSLSA